MLFQRVICLCHTPCHYQCATRSVYERVLAQAFWVLHCLSQVSEYMCTIATLPLVTASLILGLLWRCPVVELPRLLHLMTRGSHGTMTYEIQAGHSGVGDTIQLTFTVPVDVQGGHKDGQ